VIAHAKPHAPLDLYATEVASEWVDYNGHMNDAAFAVVFSRSVDALMDRIGLDAGARKQTRRSLFTLQMMLHYFKEARGGDALSVSCHLLEHDDKRMRVWLDMTDASGERLAASEQLLMSVALTEGAPRAAPWGFETLAALDALQKLHASLPHPPQAGAGVALKRKASP
jgi:acyl-CoA thioester hydrolase